jgi:hypothetical protein
VELVANTGRTDVEAGKEIVECFKPLKFRRAWPVSSNSKKRKATHAKESTGSA